MADRMIANDATNGITTDDGTSPSMNHLASPLRPIVHSRLEERAELQNLNNRFASYIKSVRILEVENARLNATLKSAKESFDREKMAMKKHYDDKLAETRQSLKVTSSEKDKLALDHTEAVVSNYNLRCKLRELRQRMQENQESLNYQIIARIDAENSVRQYRDDLMLQDQIHDEEMNETKWRQMDASGIASDISEQIRMCGELDKYR